MARPDLIRRLRPLLVWGGIIPAVLLVIRLVTNQLGADPPETLEEVTGMSTLVFLLASLAATPLRLLTGRAAFTSWRKPLGLWAFAYGVMHFLCYLVFDMSLIWSEVWYDIAERPYITVGFAALMILLVLAVTSPAAMQKRLGGARWKKLHRGAYVAAILGVLHFLWQVKLDGTEPYIAGTILAGLFAIRWWKRPGAAAPAGRGGALASEP